MVRNSIDFPTISNARILKAQGLQRKIGLKCLRYSRKKSAIKVTFPIELLYKTILFVPGLIKTAVNATLKCV